RGFLASGESSFIVPTSVHKTGAGDTIFTSDGWLRNLSPDPVDFTIYAAPSGQNGQLDAFRVDQTIPPFATLRLFDFIYGLSGNTQSSLFGLLNAPETKVESGSLVVEPVSGSGRVVAIGTLIDNASSSFQALSSRVIAGDFGSSARGGIGVRPLAGAVGPREPS